MLNVLIVDDEEPAHEVLLHHLSGEEDVQIVGRCYDASEALQALREQAVDLMLLDIKMPGFGGLDLLRGLKQRPLAIIISAHREHALDGYELDVVDYLLKPVNEKRFKAALDKARRRLETDQSSAMERQRDIIVKVDRSMRRFLPQDITCLEAHGNYVKIWTDAGRPVLATDTLRRLLGAVRDHGFIQVHKSFVVNRARVSELHGDRLVLDTGQHVPIGKTFRPAREEIFAGKRSSKERDIGES